MIAINFPNNIPITAPERFVRFQAAKMKLNVKEEGDGRVTIFHSQRAAWGTITSDTWEEMSVLLLIHATGYGDGVKWLGDMLHVGSVEQRGVE